VLVAEDITSRFLNVIGLFNNTIPVVAIQMAALRIGDQVALTFSTVLGELTRGLEDSGVDLMPYGWGRYRIRLTKADLAKHETLVHDLLRRAYDSRA
jgi:hypothetical protein